MRNASPLRYPGGKWRIYPFFQRLIKLNKLVKPVYVEGYAGGASLGLSLLFNDVVSEIVLNDIDPAIYAFWKAVTTQGTEFIELLDSTPITTDEWLRQRAIYNDTASDLLSLGFATFYLNRTNYSGILNGGMIGGRDQSGKYKLDARFNKSELKVRIERIFSHRSRIHVFSDDAMSLIQRQDFLSKHIFFLDPPYYKKGQRLYHNSYAASDHSEVSRQVQSLGSHWVVSYDDIPEIRLLYKDVKSRRLALHYSARESRNGAEVLFFRSGTRVPKRIF